MDLVYFTLWFLVTIAMIWDTKRMHGVTQEILRDIQASTARGEATADRIAQMSAEALRLSAEVLRRTPTP